MRKWATSQVEWYRDNKKLLPSQALAWDGFFLFRDNPGYGITAFFLADRIPEIGTYLQENKFIVERGEKT